jgi:hypothetical protein
MMAYASAISSAIETEKSETGGKQWRTAVNRARAKWQKSERLGDERTKSVKNGKADSMNPCLPAKFDPRVGTSCKPKNHKRFIVATMLSPTGT